MLLLVGQTLCAQQIQVFDSSTEQPIADVTLSSLTANAKTDSKGRVNLKVFSPNDTLLVQHVSYHDTFILAAKLAKDGKLPLLKRAYLIPPITISGNKWEQDERKIGDQITLLDSKTIQRSESATAADLLASSGEVFVQKSQAGGGSPMLRGFAANRVLIVVDGVRMNNAIYRSGNLQNVLNVDPNMLQLAEVIHGPGAMTYGSDAIGGVMDFHTYDPTLRADSARLMSGAFMYRRTGASAEESFSLRLNAAWKKVALLAGLSISDLGDPRMGANGPDEYLRRFSVMRINGQDSVVSNPDPSVQLGNAHQLAHSIVKLRYRPSDSWNIVLSARNSNVPSIPRYDRLIQLSNGEPRYAEWKYDNQNWSMLNAKVEHFQEKGAWNKARLSAAYQVYEEARVDRRYRQDTNRVRQEEVRGVWLNLDLDKDINEGTEFFYGLEAVWNRVNSNGYQTLVDTFFLPLSFNSVNSRYPDNSTWYTYSGYGSISKELGEQFVFNGGLRANFSGLQAEFDPSLFDYPVARAELNNSALTGSAGIIWNHAENGKVSLDLSRGFRSPNIDDIGKVFDSEPGILIVPNTELGAEYVTSIELGARIGGKENFSISANVYLNILDNAIVRRPFTLNGADSVIYEGELSEIQALQNAAQARVFGVHVGAQWRVSKFLRLRMNVNLQDGEEELDDGQIAPSRHVPPAFGNCEALFEKGKWQATLSWIGSMAVSFENLAPSEQNKAHIYAIDENGLPYSPAWYTVNARVRYQVIDALSLSVSLDNMTDQRYRTYSSGVVSPARNIGATLRLNF